MTTTSNKLSEQLQAAKEQLVATAPAEIYMALFRTIQEQQETGRAFGLPVGSKAKDFLLTNATGESITLYEELNKGPVVLTFYRGGWCPYCNLQLKAYQGILPQIEALGGKLLAVSPQSPDNTLSHKEKAELDFEVLSDINGLVAAKYNLLYDVPDYLKEVSLNAFGLNLAEYNGTDRWILPVPATFMIDESATIRSAFVKPDFMVRLEPELLLNELKKL
ncbi:putative peroxiredoxin bcp [compost metagenome]